MYSALAERGPRRQNCAWTSPAACSSSTQVSGVALGDEVKALNFAVFSRLRSGSLTAAQAEKAREILKIGVFYDTVEETLAANGFAPNRPVLQRAAPQLKVA